MPTNKNPAALARAKPGLQGCLRLHFTKVPLKWRRVLAAFFDGRDFNRFEAEHELHDHCLHSTVATLQAKGLIVRRREEVVPGFQGIPTHVMRYWLAPESYENARKLLGKADASPGTNNALDAVL